MDQYGNSVDGEIRVPAKEWRPLGPHDWISRVEIGSVKDGSQKPLKTARTEWAIAFADGRVEDVIYDSEGEALQELTYKRKWLKALAIPEEHWPILMERTVETVASSWKVRSA